MTRTLDLTNPEMQNAYDLIAKTNKSFFLTGRAGTGKTTFLKNIRDKVAKKFVVLAPSGVAAINAGGQTIHSFFGFDFSVQGPLSMGRMNANKIAVAQHVDTIILDEVSMVRCDIIDAIDRMLRFCRHSSLPFGGVQMVFVGDLFQLPPVVGADAKDLIQHLYGDVSGHFYKAHCLQNVSLPKIEFKRIYRQADNEFIDLLERFRTGSVSIFDLEKINRNVSGTINNEDMRITLTVFRKDARTINEARLNAIEGETWKYNAQYVGDTSKLKDVVEDALELKVGAQVMFLRNDCNGNWANGTIGRITSLDDDKIGVMLDNDVEHIIERESWEAFDYQYDEITKTCNKEVVGTVTQFPLRLAWAITIHKSQGLTFNKVAIDFGRGAFSYGQAYVALSRARSLEGLQLMRPIDFNSVRVSRDILTFASSYNDKKVIATELSIGEAVREYEVVGNFDGAAMRLFDMSEQEAVDGNIDYAFDLFNRAMSYVADDSCLFSREWKTIPVIGKDSIILNAAAKLYSGETDEAISMLLSVLSMEDVNFNCLYMLARALEQKENWDMAQEFMERMMAISTEMRNNGLDSASFRKFKFRYAILSERFYGLPSIEGLLKLIAENPDYTPYYAVLRGILLQHTDKVNISGTEDNPLIVAILDPGVDENSFISLLDSHRKGKTGEWKRYQRSLSRLKINKNAETEENVIQMV